MYHNTLFVGMDVHKETFSLCCYPIEKDEFSHPHTTAADYKHVLAYLASLRAVFGENVSFLCGYEAGCLGYTLYHQLTEHHITCVILAPTTMPVVRGKKKIKTDRRDARNIAKCLRTMITALCIFQRTKMKRSRNISACMTTIRWP
ncbi:transposase [Enterocloster clostridioformis]